MRCPYLNTASWPRGEKPRHGVTHVHLPGTWKHAISSASNCETGVQMTLLDLVCCLTTPSYALQHNYHLPTVSGFDPIELVVSIAIFTTTNL